MVTVEVEQAILGLSKLRNKYVHFFCTDSLEFVTAVQLKAWHHVLELLQSSFIQLTFDQREQLGQVQARMVKHEEFIQARFEEIHEAIDDLRNNGVIILECPFCEKPSLKIGDDTKCLVCGGEEISTYRYADAYIRKAHPYFNSKDYYGQELVAYCSECGEQGCIPVPRELNQQAEESILAAKNMERELGMDLEPFFCLNCGAFLDSVDLRECGVCGTRYFDEAGERMCPACSNRF